jgi:peptidoglycan/xylan/chitin deacetylase (PgdA/CDA1 family)
MRRLILTFAAIAPIVTIALIVMGRPWSGIAVLALSNALILIPTLMPNVQWLGPVVTRFESTAKEAWLTIDDGPGGDMDALLAVLQRHDVRATFFVKGADAIAYPERVRMLLALGHTIGNHSQTHPSGSFWCLPPAGIRAQIDGCSDALRSVTGSAPQLFRAPVGMKNPFVHPVLRERGLTLVGWTVRGFDAVRDRGAEEVASRVVRGLKPGAIVVTHQGRPWSAPTLDVVIAAVHRAGYRFVLPDAARLKTNR